MMNHFRAKNWLAAIAIALVSAGTGWVAANEMRQPRVTGAEVAATIQQVRSLPNNFAGKRVRLVGKLNECYGWECSLCPEALTTKDRNADQCLPLSFRPLVNGTGFGSDEQESVFRFSSVVLTAKFDPSCWKLTCTDRQTVLLDATVEAVTKQRAGASGLWVTKTTRLTRIDGNTASELRLAALRAGYPENPPIHAFTTAGPDRKLVVCWSSPAFGEKDPGAWPATFESALYAKSTLDFFQCNEVRKIDDRMVVQTAA